MRPRLSVHLVVVAITSSAALSANRPPQQGRPSTRPTTRPDPTAEWLRNRVPDIEFHGVPFGTATGVMKEITNATLTVHWSALRGTGVSYHGTKVSFRTRGTTVEDAVRLLLARADPAGRVRFRAAWPQRIDVSTEEGLAVLAKADRRLAALLEDTDPRDRKVLYERFGGGSALYNAKLGDFLDYFSDMVPPVHEANNPNVLVEWRAMEGVGVKRDTPVTLDIYPVSVGRALCLVLDQLSDKAGDVHLASCAVDPGGAIVISTPPRLRVRAPLRRSLSHALNDPLARDLLLKRVPEVRLAGVALEASLDYLASATGVAVDVDGEALKAAGVAPDAQVEDLLLKDRTLGEALVRVLAAVSRDKPLTFSVEGRRVKVGAVANDERRTR